MTVTPGRGLTWAALSFTGFVGSLFAVLPFTFAMKLVWDAPHLAQMGAWSVVWGVLSLVGVLVAARLVFGAWLRPRPGAVAVASFGIGLSAVLNIVLLQWETARFGYIEPELVGLTAGLFAVLIGLSVAAFGALLVPRRLIGWPLAMVALGFAGVAIIVLSNVSGLANGIGPDGWPLAICVGLSGLYALVAGGLVLRRALDRSQDALET